MMAGEQAQGAAGGHAAASLDIMTDAGGRAPRYWRIFPDAVQPMEAPQQGTAVSFCRADEWLPAAARMSPGKARKWALRETGAHCRVIVNGRARAVYAAPVSWLVQFRHRIVPSYALLSRLATAHAQHRTAAWIAGFLFTAPSGPSILVLYAMDAHGAPGKPQVTLNPDNIETALNGFAQLNGIPLAGGENVLLFDNHDVLAGYRPGPAYPDDEKNAHIGLRAARTGLMVVALAACAVGVGRYAMLLRQTTAVKARVARLQRDMTELKRANDQLLLPNLKGYARLLSLDRKKLFAAANAIWQPGSVIRIDATDRAVNLALVFRAETPPAERLMRVAAATSVDTLFRRAGKLPTPPGLQRVEPSVSGDLNAFSLNYTYQDASADLVRFGAH